jgi:hypothetical protein
MKSKRINSLDFYASSSLKMGRTYEEKWNMLRSWLVDTHSSRILPDAGASSSQKTTTHMMVTSKRRLSMVNSIGVALDFQIGQFGELCPEAQFLSTTPNTSPRNPRAAAQC